MRCHRFSFAFYLYGEQDKMAKRKRTSSASDETIPDEATHILDVAEDCLQTILSFLPTIDLCAVKETCQRFEGLAERTFVARYRDRSFIFGPKIDDHTDRADFSEAVRVLHHFGRLIRALSVHYITEEEDSFLWEVVLIECSALSEIKVTGCALRSMHYYRRLADTMEHLILNKCMGSDEDFCDAIYSFQNLKRLTVEYGHYGLMTGYLRRQIPNLEEITVRCVRTTVQVINNMLPFFITANPQLKRIHLNFNFVKCDILDVIATHSLGLESLSLQLNETNRTPFPEDIAKLRRLQHLRELQISCAAYKESIRSPIEALADQNLLHTLSISDTKIDLDLWQALSKMTNLKTLKLVKMRADSSLKKSLTTSSQKLALEHLHVIACEGIQYKHIVAIIDKFKSLLSLTFHCCCDCDIDDTLYSQLIAARKSSGACSTLNVYLPLSVLKVAKRQAREGKSDVSTKFVQLQKIDDKMEYVYGFFAGIPPWILGY